MGVSIQTRKIIGVIVFIPLFVLGFFALAGRWDWAQGWGFIVVATLGSGLHDLYLWRKNPELFARRSVIGEGTKSWDKVCLSLFGIFYVAVLAVGALDGGRFGWSTMSVWLWPLGAALYIISLIILAWSMSVNPYFEKTARIQRDRDHHVIDTGPYQFVRHPGYLATIFGYVLGTPLMLGSWWAFVPASLAALCLVIRTALEDRMLRTELTGYADYAQRVPYRLLPGIW